MITVEPEAVISSSPGRSWLMRILFPLISVTNVSRAKQPEDDDEAEADAEADEPKTNDFSY